MLKSIIDNFSRLLVALNFIKKIPIPKIEPKTIILLSIAFLCWYGLTAIMDFSSSPAVTKFNLPNIFLLRHITALLFGVSFFYFALRYGRKFSTYWLVFTGISIFLFLMQLLFGQDYDNTRKWLHLGFTKVRVAPAILLFALPSFCYFCQEIENGCREKLNSIYLIVHVILMNVFMLVLKDVPLFMLTNILLFIIMMFSKVGRHLNVAYWVYMLLLTIILFIHDFMSVSSNFSLIEASLKDKSGKIFETVRDKINQENYQTFYDVYGNDGGGMWYGEYTEIHNWVSPGTTMSSLIFQVIIREHGIPGLLFTLLLYALIAISTLKIRKKSENGYTQKLIIAMMLFIILPALLGLLRTLCVFHLLPLYQIPFIGYGRSWLILNFVAAGIVLSHDQNDKNNLCRRSVPSINYVC